LATFFFSALAFEGLAESLDFFSAVLGAFGVVGLSFVVVLGVLEGWLAEN
jgi:hypothetical protein